MSASARLAELGISLPPVAAPVAAYVPAVRSGAYVFTSGQLPMVDGVLSVSGIVGEISADDAAAAARIAALNALAAAASVAGGVDGIARIVKVTVFVASTPEFTGQPAVANGASDVLTLIFDTPHARSAVGVASLPLNTPVEVELVAELA
ncbi:Enamine deaminase RidA, house cleaning of reactive enamine intermediates, YjgF/YER057c/UK114 family [Ruaniaceae bacterium KH17]|nr:Enamine deaminase RidA, house cleaning of reactive enamine intermediates, YjgF/YER057c/UK114 family [Ruaniaceae bacterium KH17]